MIAITIAIIGISLPVTGIASAIVPPAIKIDTPPLGEVPLPPDVIDIAELLELLPCELPDQNTVLDCIPLDVGDVDADAPSATCSGGSSTVTGWTTGAAGVGVNMPASSYYTITWTYVDGAWTVTSADGHTKSATDTFEIKVVDGVGVAHWNWIGLPMGGTADGGGVVCQWIGFTGVVTSVSLDLQGAPLVGGVGVVRSWGTTCVIPC